MGKSSPKAPAAPDPVATASAQTTMNKETAYWNAKLNNVNQYTPYGSLTYTEDTAGRQAQYEKDLAAWQLLPAKGNGYAPKLSDYAPQFTSKVELSPEQQKLYETQVGQDQRLLDIGGQQMERINQSVSTPYSYSGLPNAPTQQDINALSQQGQDAIMSRLNPQFAQDEEALRTRLINQGIGQGSEAYNREFDQFGQMKNDARTQAILQGQNYGATQQGQQLGLRNQAIQEYNSERNAPLNEYSALTSGTQVQNPNFSSTGYQGAAPVDYAGLVNGQYQNQLAQYNQKVAGGNSTKSALFGLAGTAAGAFLGGPMGAQFGGWVGSKIGG